VITGKQAPTGPVRNTFIGREGHPPGTGPSPSGVAIDGGVYPLAGQPPTAASKGWGNLSWVMSPFYNRAGGLPVVGSE